jgi:glycolate oxidase iron-sulfur subunit
MDVFEKCVLCGSCKAPCPTFAGEGVEPMSARGRVVVALGLLKGELAPSERLDEILHSCLLCGLCEPACPAGVEVTEAVYAGRAALVKAGDRKRRLLRAAALFAARNPSLSYRAARMALPFAGRWLEGLPFRAELGRRPLRHGPQILKPEGKRKGRVAVFAGCAVNYMSPRLGVSLVNVLLQAGYEVVLPAGEVCCGAPLRSLGLDGEVEKFANRNVGVFGRLKAEAIVSLCPTCTLVLRKQYGHILGMGLENAVDVTEFLRDRLHVVVPGGGKVFYHDPCHLRHGLGVKEEPRAILKAMGYEASWADEPSCCGFGAGLTFKEASRGYAEKTAGRMKGAAAVVTACPGCMMQLGRLRPGVRHIIELVEKASVEGG